MDGVQNENLTITGERRFPPATLDTSLDLPNRKYQQCEMTILGHLTNTTVFLPPTVAKPASEIPWRIAEAKPRDGPPNPPPYKFKEGEVCIRELLEACTSIRPTSLASWVNVASVYNAGCENFDYGRQDGEVLRKNFNQIIKTPPSCKKVVCRATAIAQKSGVRSEFNASRRQPITSTPNSRRMEENSTAKERDTAPSESMSIPSGSNSNENNPILPASTAAETEDHPVDKEKTIARLRKNIAILKTKLSVSNGRREALERGTRMMKRNNEGLLRDMKKLYDKIAGLEGVIKDLEGFASDPHYDPSKNKRTAEPCNDEKVLHPAKRNKITVDIGRRGTPGVVDDTQHNIDGNVSE